MLKTMFGTWLVKMLKFRRANCKELVPIAELNGVASLCKLFTCLGTKENGVSCVHLSGAVFFLSLSYGSGNLPLHTQPEASWEGLKC